MGLRTAHGGRKRNVDDIPMAAMPDIAFLLLMFFMVSTTFLIARSVDVELPAYAQERPKEQPDYMTIFLAEDSVRVEHRGASEKIELWELEGRVSDALADAEEASRRVVMLDVHDDCSYQRVIEAFDAIRKADGYVTLIEPEPAKE